MKYMNKLFTDISGIFSKEKWKQAVKPYDKYEVSTLGNYRKLGTTQNLKFFINGQGYKFAVVLNSETNSIKRVRMHNLMCQTFYPQYTEKLKNHELIVNHIDENKGNNVIENLQVCTRGENMKYGVGYYKMIKNFCPKKGEKKGNWRKVLQYTMDRQFVKEYESTRDTENYGFKSYGVIRCCNGMYKQHHGYIWKYKEALES